MFRDLNLTLNSHKCVTNELVDTMMINGLGAALLNALLDTRMSYVHNITSYLTLSEVMCVTKRVSMIESQKDCRNELDWDCCTEGLGA